MCVCQGAGGSESSRSPPPTSTTEQKTRPPPLHTRYPLVSTSIEDLFYRSLQTLSRAYARSLVRAFHAGAEHYFRLIYGSGRSYTGHGARFARRDYRLDPWPVGAERRSAKFADRYPLADRYLLSHRLQRRGG